MWLANLNCRSWFPPSSQSDYRHPITHTHTHTHTNHSTHPKYSLRPYQIPTGVQAGKATPHHHPTRGCLHRCTHPYTWLVLARLWRAPPANRLGDSNSKSERSPDAHLSYGRYATPKRPRPSAPEHASAAGAEGMAVLYWTLLGAKGRADGQRTCCISTRFSMPT